MIRKLLVCCLICSVLGIKLANAQEASDYQEPEAPIFIEAHQQKPAKNIKFPSCNDTKLLENVVYLIKEYYDLNKPENIKEYRQQILLQKNISTFEEVDIKTFNPETNYNVANILLMNKINYGMQDEEMRLCHISNKEATKDLYLLIYPDVESSKFKVEVLNFLPNNSQQGDFAFLY